MAKEPEIPQSALQIEERRIPSTAVERIDEQEREVEPFTISYKYYNDRLCQYQDLRISHLRKVLETFRVMGRCCQRKDLARENIQLTPIDRNRKKEYRKLYSHQPPDADILELDIGKSQRMFFWILESNRTNTIHLVCLRNKHFEI
jgi:hypothetical protein